MLDNDEENKTTKIDRQEDVPQHTNNPIFDLTESDEIKTKEKGPLDHMPNFSSAFPALLLFSLFGVASTMFWNHPLGQFLWLNRQSIIIEHEYWRLLTSLFVHADWLHLLSNTPLFLIFGWFLHAFFGAAIFPILALLTGILSNYMTIIYMPLTTKLIGASGMLYGMVALWLVLFIKFDVQHNPSIRVARAVAFCLIVLAPTTYQPQTSYLAHAFGFLIGSLFGFTSSFFVRPKTPKKGLSEQNHPL
ncbi:MAG: rhomboid family intramembrane serine protease [Bdellovibrionota bacterium]